MTEETSQHIDLSDVSYLCEHWTEFDLEHRHEYFFQLPRSDAEELFLDLSAYEQYELVGQLPRNEKRSWIRLLPLDDTADFIQKFPIEEREDVLSLLDSLTQREVKGLLAYAEDDAGGLMNPRYIRLRPEMTADEAIRYIRAQAKTNVETVYYTYVLDSEQKLLGVISFRELLLISPDKFLRDIMRTDFISVPEEMDREEVARLIIKHNLMSVPVLDELGKMKGIITHDDIVDVLHEEATEDIQKLGGMEALDKPYFKASFWEMIKKRAGWLMVLFVGEMFTATAMGYYEHELQSALILALFIPLIISSGGNSGSQATTLIIRSLALREIRLRDWWKVVNREIGAGFVLGLILGLIALIRVFVSQYWQGTFGEHYLLIGMTVAISLTGVVMLGTITGSMLPLALRRLGFDPASASAPFVATIVDVTGLIIYFTVASVLLRGALL